ncbi:Gfo/Idh/MocA family oxidoreductase [Escherichia coli]
MKIGTQNQAFFPENILEKFRYIKEMGFDGFEIDGKLLVNNLEEVKAAIKETGLPVTTACGGYDGWIGDFIEERRLNGLKQIERILEALAEVGGKGIVVPAAWGMFTFRLPPMTSPRSLDGDRKMVSDSLRVLEQVAARTGTVVYLEPLNRYQDHMINTLADARRYIVENDLKHVQIIGDFYHMNIEEDNLAQALAEKYGNASVWDDPQAMLLAVKPDVVSVCSPNRFHYEHTLMALEAGCHVMCEKPPAMTPEQAREMCDTARKLGKVLAYDFHHRFALDTQQLRDQVTNGVLGEIYVTTARALRRCGVPGWGVFTNKELQGGGPLIDIGIHMLDAAMYVLGFPAVKSVNAHSFQKIGTQKSCGQFGEWDPATYSVEDSLFGTIEFHNGGILWLETSFALNIREQSIMNVSFCGDKAGATLFPAHIYTDNNGELMTLMQRELADDNRHLRSMEAFINHVQGKPVMIADAEQGYIIQQLVAALYQSAETGTRVEL